MLKILGKTLEFDEIDITDEVQHKFDELLIVCSLVGLYPHFHRDYLFNLNFYITKQERYSTEIVNLTFILDHLNDDKVEQVFAKIHTKEFIAKDSESIIEILNLTLDKIAEL